MAINLASKFSNKVDERFTLKSVTEMGVNQNYEWTGVDTVKVYSIDTVAMGDYTRTGASRYGVPTELSDTIQTMTLTKDRAFTFTVDRGNNDEQMQVKDTNKALSRQINEVVIPEIDTYRLGVMSASAIANGASKTLALTKDIAYENFLLGGIALDEAKVPQTGRIAYVTPTFYSLIKQDPAFVKASEAGMKIVSSGVVGDVDGVTIVKVPSNYLPANTAFLFTHKMATVSPKKLETYKTHIDPPGINGTLAEGRVIYDAFVLDNKVDCLYLHKVA